MTKYFIGILSLLIFTSNLSAQKKEYRLIKRTGNADFNYKAIYAIDEKKPGEEIRKVFDPVGGKFDVYVFIATFNGLSFTNKRKQFHDVLIIKTSNDRKIIDAFQYTLEWAEMPFSYDLFRANNKNVTLRNRLSIDKLNLRRVGTYKNEGSEDKEQGVILF